MTDYSYNNVISLLESIGAKDITPYKLPWYFRDNHPELLQEIVNNTINITNSKFREKLYCYANNIKERPACHYCCVPVTYDRNKRCYHKFCSGPCAIRYSAEQRGITNVSQLPEVKAKKKQKALERYGVDNISKAPEVRAAIARGRVKYWERVLGSLRDSLIYVDLKISEKEYRRLVDRISNWMYRTHIDKIDPDKLRSPEWHLDHKVSIMYGFKNGISPHIIGDINNLEILPAADNIAKSYRSSIHLNELLEMYNEFYSKNEKPSLTEVITSEKLG